MLSGVIKESVLFIGIGMFIPIMLRFADRSRLTIQNLVLASLGLCILIMVKPYFLASLVPALIIHIVWQRGQIQKSPWLGWASLAIIIVASLWFLDIHPIEHIARKQNDFINHSAIIGPGSEIHLTPLQNTPKSILVELPTSLFNVLIEPLPTRVTRPGEWVMLIENIMLWSLIGLSLWQLYKHRVHQTNIHLVIQGIIPGLLLIGLISPVLGATMRYRAPFLLLLILAIIPYLHPLITSRDE